MREERTYMQTFTLYPKQISKLDQLSREMEVSKAEVVRRAIEEYYQKRKEELREEQ